MSLILAALTIGSGQGINPTDVPITGVRVAGIVSQFFIVFTWIFGVVAVFSLLLAGFNYITAGGDSDKAATARRQIIYSIIGILIASSTFVIYSATRKVAQNAASSTIGTSL
jgi:hypothetical protein